MSAVEEDGDEIFTPTPKVCGVCGGDIKRRRGHAGGWWWMCEKHHSYGEAKKSVPVERTD